MKLRFHNTGACSPTSVFTASDSPGSTPDITAAAPASNISVADDSPLTPSTGILPLSSISTLI